LLIISEITLYRRQADATIRSYLGRGLPMLLVPPLALSVILIKGDFYFLEYFHVLAGSAWTGMDLVMGIFFTYVMKGLSNVERSEVARRLMPSMLFFMPAIATTTITAGVYLALDLHISFFYWEFIVVAVIALILTAQGLMIFLPNEVRVYLEIVSGRRNVEKIVRLTMMNLRLSLIQLILQIILIVFMASFATGVSL